MRRVAMLPMFLALLVTFFMAPYQHVHLATGYGGAADHDHEDLAVVHAHFYAVSGPMPRKGGSDLKDLDGDHVSLPLDTFKPMPQAGFSAIVLPESRILLIPRADLLLGVVAVTEPCGHDPPFLDFSVPRAPPV